MEDGLVLVSMQANQLDEMDVLILVVVEDGLVPGLKFIFTDDTSVLILVVVEDGLVRTLSWTLQRLTERLNPCCSGRWSRTGLKFKFTDDTSVRS